MDKPFYLLAILLMFVFCWLIQEENQLWDQQRQLLKSANNKATHDALYAASELNSGHVRIDPVTASNLYIQSLQLNLGLDHMMQPKSGSPVYSGVRIVHFEIIDDFSGRSFPFIYENSSFNITKFLRGPAVVGVIEVDTPSIFRGSHSRVRVPAIYEYARAS